MAQTNQPPTHPPAYLPHHVCQVWDHDFEYRVDVTMREKSLEYDVIVMNKAGSVKNIKMNLSPNHDTGAAAITAMKGYTAKVGETGVETPAWDVPVAKLKEHAFYVKVEPK